MKNWQETRELYQRIAAALDAGDFAVLATIVAIEGSTYRRPGAKLLIQADGTAVGNVSGGCLENDVIERAANVLKSGDAARAKYETGDEEDTVWGMGLGCNGRVDLFLQRFSPDDHAFATQVLSALDGNDTFVIATVVTEGEGELMAVVGGQVITTAGDETVQDSILTRAREALQAQASCLVDVDGNQVFIEVLHPPPQVIVCGAGDDAIPLVRAAAEVGFRVTVVDHRAAYLDTARFPSAVRWLKELPEDVEAGRFGGPDSYAVVKTHSLKHDAAWVAFFVQSGAPYIGLLGPRGRRDEIIASVPEAERPRVYGPVGLDLGAEGPEQVAMSVVAEILAAWSGRAAGHLRDRQKAIHEE